MLTVQADGSVDAATPTGGSGSAITVTDETTELTTSLTALTFTGEGVDCTEPSADQVSCAIPQDTAMWARAAGAIGTAPVARLGTGTPTNSDFLRGDGVWAVPAGGGTALTTTIKQWREGTTLTVPAAQLTAATGAGDDDFHGPHDLGREPDFVEVYLENTIADRGYAVGDRILWPTSQRLLVGYDDTEDLYYDREPPPVYRGERRLD